MSSIDDQMIAHSPATYSSYSPATSLSSLNTAINNMNQNGQLTNTLWSILMGGTADARAPIRTSSMPADDHSGNNNHGHGSSMHAGLLSHLKQNYPQINPELFLQQLMGSQSLMQRQPQANDHSLQNHHSRPSHQRYKQPAHNHPGDRMNSPTGSTTTIVNPLAHLQAAGGNQPLVQVIHVPVSSSIPNHMFKQATGQSPNLAAYDTASNATIVNNDTLFVAYDGYETGEEIPSGGYLSSAKDSRYTISANEAMSGPGGGSDRRDAPAGSISGEGDEGSDSEYDDDGKRTLATDASSSGSSSSSAPGGQMIRSPNDSDNRNPGSGEAVSTAANQASNNSLTKRMLSQKINFNYHPILEYIPVEAASSFLESSTSSFSPRKQRTSRF